MPDFRFEPVGHRYYLDAEEIPSLSAVLKDYTDLSHVPDQTLVEDAAIRGADIHKELELYDKGELDEYHSIYTQAWAEFRQQSGFYPIQIEQPIYHPILLYGVTPDRVGHVVNDGWIIDIKTGSHKNWHPLQTAGQALAVESELGWYKENIRRACWHVDKEGKWSLHEHNDKDDFGHIMALRRIRLTDWKYR